MDSLLGLLLELVGTKDTDTVVGLGIGKTVLVTLEELEDLLHDNVLNVDLVLVVQVGSSELDLWRVSGFSSRYGREGTYSVHVDLGVQVLVLLLLEVLVLSLLLLRLGYPASAVLYKRMREEERNIPGVPGSPATFSVVGTEVSLRWSSACHWAKARMLEEWRDSLGRSLVLDVLLRVRHGG